MMLPPASDNVLAANPKFEALYHDLCTNKLNADGTTRLDGKAVKERQVAEQELHKIRVETAKRTVIQRALHDLTYNANALPDELQELVAITAASLDGDIAQEDREIVLDELEDFKDNIAPISQVLSTRLQSDVTSLTEVFAPGQHIPIDELPVRIRELQDSITSQRSQLSTSRLALATQISTLHALYRQVMETSIRILEQTMHGSITRGTKAKADYLALVAEGMSKKLAVQHLQLLQQVYSPEVQDVLRAESEEIDVETRSVRRKAREAEEQLERYRETRGMRGMVNEYAEILRESEKVRGEIERLEGR